MFLRVVGRTRHLIRRFHNTTAIRRSNFYPRRFKCLDRCQDASLHGRMIKRRARRQVNHGTQRTVKAAAFRSRARLKRKRVHALVLATFNVRFARSTRAFFVFVIRLLYRRRTSAIFVVQASGFARRVKLIILTSWSRCRRNSNVKVRRRITRGLLYVLVIFTRLQTAVVVQGDRSNVRSFSSIHFTTGSLNRLIRSTIRATRDQSGPSLIARTCISIPATVAFRHTIFREGVHVRLRELMDVVRRPYRVDLSFFLTRPYAFKCVGNGVASKMTMFGGVLSDLRVLRHRLITNERVHTRNGRPSIYLGNFSYVGKEGDRHRIVNQISSRVDYFRVGDGMVELFISVYVRMRVSIFHHGRISERMITILRLLTRGRIITRAFGTIMSLRNELLNCSRIGRSFLRTDRITARRIMARGIRIHASIALRVLTSSMHLQIRNSATLRIQVHHGGVIRRQDVFAQLFNVRIRFPRLRFEAILLRMFVRTLFAVRLLIQARASFICLARSGGFQFTADRRARRTNNGMSTPLNVLSMRDRQLRPDGVQVGGCVQGTNFTRRTSGPFDFFFCDEQGSSSIKLYFWGTRAAFCGNA